MANILNKITSSHHPLEFLELREERIGKIFIYPHAFKNHDGAYERIVMSCNPPNQRNRREDRVEFECVN